MSIIKTRKGKPGPMIFLIIFLKLIILSTLSECSLPLEWMPTWMYRSEVLKESLNKTQGKEYKESVENFVAKFLRLFNNNPSKKIVDLE